MCLDQGERPADLSAIQADLALRSETVVHIDISANFEPLTIK